MGFRLICHRDPSGESASRVLLIWPLQLNIVLTYIVCLCLTFIVPLLLLPYPPSAYDGGDCCECTCVATETGGEGGGNDYGCNSFACIDPAAPCVNNDDITIDIVANCDICRIGDAHCDEETNTPECGTCLPASEGVRTGRRPSIFNCVCYMLWPCVEYYGCMSVVILPPVRSVTICVGSVCKC